MATFPTLMEVEIDDARIWTLSLIGSSRLSNWGKSMTGGSSIGPIILNAFFASTIPLSKRLNSDQAQHSLFERSALL